MKRVLLVIACVASLVVGYGSVHAAPITCPGSQVTVHRAGDQWDCVNKGGNANESDQEKNDNHPN